MGSHYIPVGKIKIDKEILDIACPAAGYGETPPPPEIYCPAEGYIPDPSIYHEDPIITEAPRPPVGQIRLIATDSGSRHIQFKCQVSSSKKYVVTVTGADGTIIETQTKNNNAVFSTFVPLGAGYIAEGYTYYYIDIAPEDGYDLTLFQATINTTYDGLGGYMIAAYFNAPEISDLSLMFKNNKRITYIEFVSNVNNLTTLKECCYGADELEKFVFPAQMNGLLDVESGWRLTPNFKEFNFKDVSTPVLENMKYFLAQTGLKNFAFPKNIDSVLNLQYGCQNSKNLENVTLYESAENLEYIDYLWDGCEKLKGKVNYPEMPNLINLEYIHRNNYNVEEIQFLGSYDDETIATFGREMFLNCKKVKKIKYPEKMKMSTSYFNSIQGCVELEDLILPKTWLSSTVNYQSSSPYKAFFLNLYTNPKLKSISTVEESDLTADKFAYNLNLTNCLKLKKFIQPNIRPENIITLAPENAEADLDEVELNLTSPLVTNLYIGNCKLSLQNVKNILSKNSRLNSTDLIAVRYNNLHLINNTRYLNNANFTGNELTLPAGYVPAVNSYVCRRYLSYELPYQTNSATSRIFCQSGSYFFIPINGTKLMFRGTEENADNLGVELYKIYYVVNVSNETFQISETLGGSPVLLLENYTRLNLNMVMEFKVLSVGTGVAYMNITLSSGTTRVLSFFSDEFDFFDWACKGFYLSPVF